MGEKQNEKTEKTQSSQISQNLGFSQNFGFSEKLVCGLSATFAPLVMKNLESFKKEDKAQFEFELRLGHEHKQHANQFDAGLPRSEFDSCQKRLLESNLVKIISNQTMTIHDVYQPEVKKFRRDRLRECYSCPGNKMISKTSMVKTKLLYLDYCSFPRPFWVRASMAIEQDSPLSISASVSLVGTKKRISERTTIVCETASGTVQVDFSIIKSPEAGIPEAYEIEIESVLMSKEDDEARLTKWCRCAEEILGIFWPVSKQQDKYLILDRSSLSSPLDAPSPSSSSGATVNLSGKFRPFVLIPRSIHPWINKL